MRRSAASARLKNATAARRWTRPQPSPYSAPGRVSSQVDQQGFDHFVGGIGVLAAKLRATHRLAHLAEVEGRPQARAERGGVGVISHEVIVWSFPADGKVAAAEGRHPEYLAGPAGC